MIRVWLLTYLFFSTLPAMAQVHTIYVSTKGQDTNSGTIGKPLRTLEKALSESKTFSGENVSIQLFVGTYYLSQTLKIKSVEKQPLSLEIKSYNNQKVIISAGRKLSLKWQLYKNGIYQAAVPEGISFERMYVNGMVQTLARYPNADTTSKVFNGTAEDATYYVRVLSWGNPFGGYVHALDENGKGSLHYKITGVDDADNVELEGGWQYTKPVHWSEKYHFVENIMVELDNPGEWYFDKTMHILYYYPPKGTDLSKAEIEVSNIKNSIELQGDQDNSVRNIKFENLNFRHNERTFLDAKEAVIGSDWAVYRGGALLLNGTENCKIVNCTFTDLGGNAITLSGYNQNDTIQNCQVSHIGAIAVSLIGKDKNELNNRKIAYSQQCAILDNTFHHLGEIEKQGTGIYLFEAKETTISGNNIYHVPGSAIRSENYQTGKNRILKNIISDEFREINNP